jgi:hypothetical protein
MKKHPSSKTDLHADALRQLGEFNKAITKSGEVLWGFRDAGDTHDKRSIVCLSQAQYETLRTEQTELIASLASSLDDSDALPKFVARFVSDDAERAVFSKNNAWQTITGRSKESEDDEGAMVGVSIDPDDEPTLLKTCKKFRATMEFVEKRQGNLIFTLAVPDGTRIRKPTGTGYVLRVWIGPRAVQRVNVAGMAVIAFRDDKTSFHKSSARFQRSDVAVPDADVSGIQFFRLSRKVAHPNRGVPVV